MKLPHLRSISFSYASHLTERDNGKFRDLIQSLEYQALYGDIFKSTAIGVVKVANDKTGWRFASSALGVGTGERGDRVCFPDDELVWTESGPMRIGEVVRRRMNVRVWSTDIRTGKAELKAVTGWHANPASSIVRVNLAGGGSVRCTPDHRVWVDGRGWVEAQNLRPGNELLGGVGWVPVAEVGDDIYADETFCLTVADNHTMYCGTKEMVLLANCLDDPHNIKDGESDPIRNKTVRWFDEGMSNRLNDLTKSAIVVIMQRVHENDVSGHIITHETDYEHLMIPMEWDGRRFTTSIGWTDPRTEYGELAWPERYPDSTLTRFRRNPFLWSGQYQQSPEPRGGGVFKRDWWKHEHVPIGRSPPQPEYVVASLDSAYTKQERNDPSGFTVWGIYRDTYGNPKVLMLGAWRKHLELHGPEIEPKRPDESQRAYIDRCKQDWGLVEWVAYDCKRLRVDRLLIEAKASGLSVAQEMQRLYANSGWGVELINPEGDKYARAIAVVHLWADGLIHVPASRVDLNDADSDLVPRDWAQMVMDEMAIFPNGRYRDLTDSATQALRHLRDIGLAVRHSERHDSLIAAAMHTEELKPLYPA